MASSDDLTLNSDAGTVYAYKWYLEFFDSDNQSTKIHYTSLEQISQDNRYMDRVCPILTMRLRFTEADLVRLEEMKKRVLCSITVKSISYRYVPETTDEKSHVEEDEEIEFSSVFIPIFDAKSFKNYRKEEIMELEQKTKALDHEFSINPEDRSVNVTFFNVKSQNMFKFIFNQVIESGSNIATVVAWILDNLNVDFLFDKPDHSGELGDVVIPPLNTVQALNYLQTMYGIYETGLLLFYDFNEVLYVLGKYEINHDMLKGDRHIGIYCDEENPGQHTTRINYDSVNDNGLDDDYTWYFGSIVVKQNDAEVLEGEIEGNNFLFSSFQQGINAVGYDSLGNPAPSTERKITHVLSRKTKTHNSSGERCVVDYDEMNNPYNMSSYFNEIEANTQSAIVEITDAKMSDFRANKTVFIKYKDVNKNEEKGGLYFLNRVIFSFMEIPMARFIKENGEVAEQNDLGYNVSKHTCKATLFISRRNPGDIEKRYEQVHLVNK